MTAPASAIPAAAVRGFAELSRADVPFAGGKGANLGEPTATARGDREDGFHGR